MIPSLLSFPSILRGEMEHDQLAIAYHLILDSRAAKSTTAPISTGTAALSSSPPGSFSMTDEVIAQIQDTPTIKKQVSLILNTDSVRGDGSYIITVAQWATLFCLPCVVSV